MHYKLFERNGIIYVVRYDPDNNSALSIPNDPANSDYQAYLAWVAAGNTPEPPDPPPVPSNGPTIDERLLATETLINLILDEEVI